jgi:hypothetical protein
MADADYSVSGSVAAGVTNTAWSGFNPSDPTTARSISNFRVNTWFGGQTTNRTLSDYDVINIQVFGN